MRWQRWTALGITGVAAIALITVYSGKTPTSVQQHANKAVVPAPAQEQKIKQMMLHRDMTSTEKLIRLDATGHVKSLAQTFSKSDVIHLQKDHHQFQNVILYDGTTGQEQRYPHAKFKAATSDQKQINHYVSYAKKAIKKGQAYESPAFPKDNPKYFVTAQPVKDKKQGAIAVMDVKILGRVQDHQEKNLRLIPYPKEGKYKVESIHADTHRDITVKTGHDNEKASHYYENEIVVTFTNPPTVQEMKQIESKLSCDPAKKIANTYIFHSDKMTMKELKSYFQKHWKPNYVEPHYLYMTNDTTSYENSEIPNDLLFSEYQWNLPIIETNRGWQLTKGSNDVIVAVVDTGVDINHPDLKGRLLKGYNVIDPNKDPVDDVGHGTHVAGIISATVNNNEGIAGMMWGGKLLPVKALDNTGSGTTYSVAQGIIWATDQGAKVINLSLGNYADAQFLHEAIKYAYDRDVVIVAATGNDNTERPGYPAAYPEVLSVSATDYNLNRASFSNYGDYIDVMAPGESIASTYPDNQYAALSGTSMASPHVAALAGLIRSINPELKNTEVMEIIRNNVIDLGDSGRDKYFGFGQVDVFSALEAAGGNSSPLQFWPQSIDRKIQSIVDQAK